MRIHSLPLLALLTSPAIAGGLNGFLPPGDTFDYVIVGGGPAGLTVAQRLTENPNLSVLVLEAGDPDNYEADVMIPLFQGNAGRRGGPCGGLNWCDQTVPQTFLDGATRTIPQGRGLGGGTLINAYLNNRGDRADYNEWATLNNDQSWSYANMLQYFKRAEHFYPEDVRSQAQNQGIGEDASQHGFSGPQSSAFPNWKYQATRFFYRAFNSLGIPTIADPQAPLNKGAMWLPQGIDNANQSRADARRRRFDPNANRANLYVATRQHVHRVLFAGGCAAPGPKGARAVGVLVSPGAGERTWVATARREVIMAAGALRTPQVLELSGIGPSKILGQIGVQTRIRLPGVGNNLQDHMIMHMSQAFNNNSIIYPNILNDQRVFNNQQALYYSSRKGMFTFGPPDGNAFLSLPQISGRAPSLGSQASSQGRGAYLVAGLDSTVIDGYEAQKKLLNAAIPNNGRAVIEFLQDNAGNTQISNMRPLTRGTVHANTIDPFAYPRLDFRYGANPIDLAVMHDALQFNNRLFHTPALQRLQPVQNDPPANPTEAQITEFLNRALGTEYHPAGTAAMLPRNLGGVVNTKLLVYGTQNLRVVDASIFPTVPAAHLQSVVYGVAERAAQIIRDANTPATNPKQPLDQSVCHARRRKVRSAMDKLAGEAVERKLEKRRAAEYPEHNVYKLGKRQTGYLSPDAGTNVNASVLTAGYPSVGYPNFNLEKCKGFDRTASDRPASVGEPTGEALKWIDRLVSGDPNVLNEAIGDVGDLLGGL